MSNITRFVRASTRSGFLRGSNTLSPTGHVLFHFDEVEAPEALVAFDAVVQNPGAFEIITRDQTRVAFLMGGGLHGALDRFLGRPIDRVTLDIWFEEDPEPELVDVIGVSPLAARAFIESVYQDLSDTELWELLELPPLTIRRHRVLPNFFVAALVAAFVALLYMGPIPFSILGAAAILGAGATYGLFLATAVYLVRDFRGPDFYLAIAVAGAAGGGAWSLIVRPASPMIYAVWIGAGIAVASAFLEHQAA